MSALFQHAWRVPMASHCNIELKESQVIEIKDFSEGTVKEAYELLRDPERAAETVDSNYDLARRYYSYPVLESHLVVLCRAWDFESEEDRV